MDFLSRAGRYALGFAVAASGLMQVINADVVRIVPKFPDWLPGHPPLAVVLGLSLGLLGSLILAGCQLRAASRGLAALLLGSFLMQRLPEIAANPMAGFVWTNPAKVLALMGGAWLLVRRTGAVAGAAAGLLGGFLVICGAQHFAYAGFVDTLVPAWIPPSQRFWTYFSAVALLAGGAGVVIPATRRLAGLLTGGMIFLWVPLLHIPLALKMRNAAELAAGFEALALAGVAWLVAASATNPDRKQVTSPE